MRTDTGATPHARRRPWALAAACVLGVCLSALLTWQRSEAAFTASTQNNANAWTMASVSLEDDDTGAALINTTAAAGQTGTACIQVSYTGSVPTPIKLYATTASDTAGLGGNVALKVEEGTGGTYAGGCAGFTASSTAFNGTFGSFITSASDFGSGVGSWTADPATSTTRSYRFTWTLDAGTSTTLQGKSVSATFVWESRA